MKKRSRLMSILLIFCIAVTVLSPAAFAAASTGDKSGTYGVRSLPFTDVPADIWYYESVDYVYRNDMMRGTSDSTFSPELTTSRGMIVTILHRMEGAPLAPCSYFSDVPSGQWYSDAVAWADVAGIANGYEDGSFRPNDTITREQMATILYRYADYCGYDVSATGDLSYYTDAGQLSGFARTAMSWANGKGLINGTSETALSPGGATTRAQAAAMFMRFCENCTGSSGPADIETVELYQEYSEEINSIEEAYLNSDGFVAQENVEPLLNEVADYARWLFINGELTDLSYSDGDTGIFMEIDGWLGFIYAPPVENAMAGGSGQVNVLTFEPFAWEMFPQYIFAGLKGPDEAAGLIEKEFSYPFLSNYDGKEASVENLYAIEPNSVVLWLGHGNYIRELGSVLFLGEKKHDQTAILLYQQELSDRALCLNSKGQFYVTERFFSFYMPDHCFDNCLIYLGACSSFADGKLAQSMWDKGARAILGNTDYVNVTYNFKMLYSFVEGLCNKTSEGQYRTITQALDYAKDKHGEHDDEFWAYGSSVLMAYRDDFTLSDMLVSNSGSGQDELAAESYRAVLAKHPEYVTHSYMSGGEVHQYQNDTEYTLYDIDKNGLPELIVREDLFKYYIYTFDGRSAVLCGENYWSYGNCLYEFEGNGLIVHNGGMGTLRIEYAALCSLTDGRLSDEEILMTTEDCTFDELYNFLDGYNRIEDFDLIGNFSYRK